MVFGFDMASSFNLASGVPAMPALLNKITSRSRAKPSVTAGFQ